MKILRLALARQCWISARIIPHNPLDNSLSSNRITEGIIYFAKQAEMVVDSLIGSRQAKR